MIRNFNIFSFTRYFNGNPKYWYRFKREFNDIVNENGSSKLIKSISTLVSKSEYDDLDLDNDDDIKKTNIYEMNTKLFSSLKLNITNIKDMVLIDKCMDSTN